MSAASPRLVIVLGVEDRAVAYLDALTESEEARLADWLLEGLDPGGVLEELDCALEALRERRDARGAA